MDLDQLRQLDVIAREGTMSSAARALRMSQSALSRSVQRLESELGCPLFDRKGKRVELNAAGNKALGYARQMLFIERQLTDELGAMARRGRAMRVATVAPAPLLALTVLMMERFPDLAFSSETLPQEQVEQGVLDGSIDLGITLSDHVLPVLDVCWLMDEHLSVSVPDDHPLTNRTVVTLSDLDGEKFLIRGNTGFWMDAFARIIPNAEFVVQDSETVHERMLKTTKLLYFVTDAPHYSFETPGRTIVPIDDERARATFYLLINKRGNEVARRVFSYASGDRDQERRP